jgi:hypothetical protein
MDLKGQPIEKWKEWLKVQIDENPDDLKNDEKYVLEAFLELIEKNTMDKIATKDNSAKPVIMKSLLLAGKLALAARLVTTANAKNISQRIEQMEEALNAYDSEIIANSNVS